MQLKNDIGHYQELSVRFFFFGASQIITGGIMLLTGLIMAIFEKFLILCYQSLYWGFRLQGFLL